MPVRARRPTAYSAERPTVPKSRIKARYAIKNAPPPLLPILAGKPHTFAMPTAEPTAESTKPQLLVNCLCLFFPSVLIDCLLVFLRGAAFLNWFWIF